MLSLVRSGRLDKRGCGDEDEADGGRMSVISWSESHETSLCLSRKCAEMAKASRGVV
jgi:hypothetical protein